MVRRCLARLARRGAAVLFVAAIVWSLGLVAGASVLAAASPARVRSALNNDPVFIDSSAEAAGLVDADRVRSAIGDAPIVVAVLPASDGEQAGGCGNLPREIAGPRTVFVLCGYQPVAGSAVLAQGTAARIASSLPKPDRTAAATSPATSKGLNKADPARTAATGVGAETAGNAVETLAVPR